MKKILFLFLLTINPLYSAEEVYKGQPFTSKEDGVFLSMSEINKMKEKIDLGDKNENLVQEYKKLIESYKKLSYIDEKLLQDYASLETYRKQALDLFQQSVDQYRKSTQMMSEVNESLNKKLNSQRRQSRLQKNLTFFIGFLSPLVGARAVNWVK